VFAIGPTTDSVKLITRRLHNGIGDTLILITRGDRPTNNGRILSQARFQEFGEAITHHIERLLDTESPENGMREVEHGIGRGCSV
jgi:hypothetical protein